MKAIWKRRKRKARLMARPGCARASYRAGVFFRQHTQCKVTYHGATFFLKTRKQCALWPQSCGMNAAAALRGVPHKQGVRQNAMATLAPSARGGMNTSGAGGWQGTARANKTGRQPRSTNRAATTHLPQWFAVRISRDDDPARSNPHRVARTHAQTAARSLASRPRWASTAGNGQKRRSQTPGPQHRFPQQMFAMLPAELPRATNSGSSPQTLRVALPGRTPPSTATGSAWTESVVRATVFIHAHARS